MRKFIKIRLSCLSVVLPLLLIGCGGGGSQSDDLEDDFGDVDSALQAVASNSQDANGITNSDIVLFWEQTSQYSYYRLFLNPDGRSGFSPLGDDIPAEDVDTSGGERVFLSRFLVADLKYKLSVFSFNWEEARFLLEGCNAEGCEQLGQQTARQLSSGAIDAFAARSPDNQFETTYGISVAISEDSLVAAIGANTASLFECSADEIIEVEVEATENCQREVLAKCDVAEGEDLPEDCPDPDAPVYKVILNAGAVYMYTRVDVFDNWQLAEVLRAPNSGEDDNFGWSVSMDDTGSRVVVTAPGEDSSSRSTPEDNSEESAGAAYLFERSDDGWLYESYLKASNGVANDLFGWDAAIAGDGSVLAVSANQRAACAGAVYIYEPNESNVWVQKAFIAAPGGQQNTTFGNSLSLDYSGVTLAAGAPQFPSTNLTPGCVVEEGSSTIGPGIVHLYNRDASGWRYATNVTASNAEKSDRFGWAVSLNGNSTGNGRATRLLVGAPTESGQSSGVNGSQGDSETRVSSGAAYLFERQGTDWSQTQYLKASNPSATDQFGNAVSLSDSGTIIAVGAWGESGSNVGINPVGDFDFVSGSGAAYVFTEDATPGLWSEVAYVKPPFINFFTSFGWALDISESEKGLIVGAPGFLGGPSVRGNVFVY